MGFDIFFTNPYWQRVLLTAVLVAAVAAVLGVFLVLRGLSLLGDGIAHIAFAGIAIAFAANLLPLPASLAWASLGALLIQEMRRRGVVKGDTAIGIIFTTSLALGYVLLAKGHVRVDVESYLFGSLYFPDPNDLYLIVGTALAVLVVLLLQWRKLFAITFNQEAAEVQGLPIRRLDAWFTVLTAAAIVVAARVVGVLLVSSLLIVPAAASLQFARSFRFALVLSPLIGVGTVLAGLYVSYTFVLPGGSSIALVAGAVFAASLLLALLLRRAAHGLQGPPETEQAP
jgi:zinc transport system permease protein